MKRERLNTAEVEMNTGSLDINIQSMIGQLTKDIDKVNKVLGTSIKISLNPLVYYEDSGNAQGDDEGEPIKDNDEPKEEEVKEEEVKEEEVKEEEVKEGDQNED